MFKFLSLCLVCLTMTACITTDLVGDKAAEIVVKRGNAYCEAPAETREKFRARVQAEAAKENGLFVKEEIVCKGD